MVNTNVKINQKGQALLFVIVGLTVVMAVGISVATRSLSSGSTTTRTDTSNRVLGAAEGGAERFLALPYNTLSNLATRGPSAADCPANPANPSNNYYNVAGITGCRIDYQATGDNIQAMAIVNVTTFNTNTNSNRAYEFDLKKDVVTEVNLVGYPINAGITICWNNSSTSNPADIYYLMYGSGGITRRGVLKSGAIGGTYSVTNGTDTVAGSCPYTGFTYGLSSPIVLNSSLLGLRVRALAGDARVSVFPTTGNSLPVQGFEITSIGQLLTQSDVSVKAVQKVKVYKTYPFLSGMFDFGLYSNTAMQ